MSLLVVKIVQRFGGFCLVYFLGRPWATLSFTGRWGPAASRRSYGSNGAGKTTCFNLIFGNCRPDSGQVWFDGKKTTVQTA